jgi:hypothetical protein
MESEIDLDQDVFIFKKDLKYELNEYLIEPFVIIY